MRSTPVEHQNLFVLSGCSGGGKSTLLEEMAKRGYHTYPEPGRQIVKEQLAIQGDALPWLDGAKFADLCISRAQEFYNEAPKGKEKVLFDRSMIDNIRGLQRSSSHLSEQHLNAIDHYRYANRVFLVPPWRDLFATDDERRHSFANAEVEYHDLVAGYTEYGYQIVVVPPDSISARADFLEASMRQD